MTDDQKYLYDLNGYLVVPEVLTRQQLDLCNEAVDHQMDKRIVANPERALSDGSTALAGPGKQYYLKRVLQWDRPWCEPFRDMLVNPKISDCLNVLLDTGYRLDTGPGIVLAEAGAEGLVLHGGGSEGCHSNAYFCRDQRFFCGLTVVEIMLADEGPGDGGLVVIPASHKANFPCPRQMKRCEQYEQHIREVHPKAGDAVIFAEATVHGALPWTASHQRRAALFRYNPGFMNYHSMPYELVEPDYIKDMTDQQRAVMQPPSLRR